MNEIIIGGYKNKNINDEVIFFYLLNFIYNNLLIL